MKQSSKLRQAGFTIVELMIATLIFSGILLTVTFGVLSFTNSYYKGVNSSTTQNTARTIADAISQAIQFSGSSINLSTTDAGTGLTYFCANNQIYIYRLGTQYTGAAATSAVPGLYVMTSNSCVLPPPPFNGGTQLLSKHMRLAALSLVPDTSPGLNQSYTVSVRLAFSSGGSAAADGDDLLCSPTASGVTNCSTRFVLGSEHASDYVYNDLTCRLQAGSQFCAISALSTTVSRRVANSSP